MLLNDIPALLYVEQLCCRTQKQHTLGERLSQKQTSTILRSNVPDKKLPDIAKATEILMQDTR